MIVLVYTALFLIVLNKLFLSNGKHYFMSTVKEKSDFIPHFYELEAWNTQKVLFGVDEVGRGCLAGPVVTAAVKLNQYATHTLLQDSKLMTVKQRLEAYLWLKDNSIFAVSYTHHRIIDAINIYQASLVCMKRSIAQLSVLIAQIPDLVVVDAMPVQFSTPDIPIIYFNFGERQSASIAAASIIAKVTRDALMTRLCPLFNGYKLAQHKGYCTQAHKLALTTLGSSFIHRRSFLKNLE